MSWLIPVLSLALVQKVPASAPGELSDMLTAVSSNVRESKDLLPDLVCNENRPHAKLPITRSALVTSFLSQRCHQQSYDNNVPIDGGGLMFGGRFRVKRQSGYSLIPKKMGRIIIREMTHPFDFSQAVDALLSRDKEMAYSTALYRVASRQLPIAAQSVGWTYLDRNGQINHQEFSRLLVIGVATYVPAELQVLDLVVLALVSIPVVILDVDEIAAKAGLLTALFPSVKEHLVRTPLVGEYRNGALEHFAQGKEALKRLNQIASSEADSK